MKMKQVNPRKEKWGGGHTLSYLEFLALQHSVFKPYIVCCSVLRRETIHFYLPYRQVEISNMTSVFV